MIDNEPRCITRYGLEPLVQTCLIAQILIASRSGIVVHLLKFKLI